MRRFHRALTPVFIALAATLDLAARDGFQQTSYESLDVCQRVPVAAIAAAVSGRPVDARPVNFKGMAAARCVYGVEIAGARHAFVVWVNPVSDFDDLRKVSEPPVTEVKGVGDDAFATTDRDTKRIQLTARTRGKVTIQITSKRMDWAQTIARVALSKVLAIALASPRQPAPDYGLVAPRTSVSIA